MTNVIKKAVLFILPVALAGAFCAPAATEWQAFDWGAPAAYAAEAQDTANIPDHRLLAGLNSWLNAYDGGSRTLDADISRSELLLVSSLSLDGSGISDITGIESCTNLRTLSLCSNSISDIGPVAGLSKLDHLYLNENLISDFSPIAAIRNTSYLRVQAMGQSIAGASTSTTTGAVELASPLSYRTGKQFHVWDFIPKGSNGAYFPATNLVTYSPAQEGTAKYRFDLDDNDSSGAGREVHISGEVSHDIDIPKCEVTFDAAGGILQGRAIAQIVLGHPLAAFPTATRTGYTFSGWRSEVGGPVEPGYTVERTQTVHAAWDANTYKITYDPAGGDTMATPYKQVRFGEPTGTLAVPSRTGYSFVGWFRQGGTRASETDIYEVAGDTGVTARWSANTYTLTFDPMGGTVSTAQKKVVYDSIYGELPEPSHAVKRFEGWHTAPSGGEEITGMGDVKITGNTTLYAHWATPDRLRIAPSGRDVWLDVDGYTYRFNRRGLPYTGLRRIEGIYYYFDRSGRLVKGKAVRVSGYRLAADGKGRIRNLPRPNRTGVASAAFAGAHKISVKWHGLSLASGYQVQYASDGRFTKEVGRVTISGKKHTVATLKVHAGAKVRYVRVRGYIKIGGCKVPGRYSRATIVR
ncbi:MAG: InlB B-repeat-containing protein [Clostridiales Family XIII bacterium]|nr:InlB B-repeat-containing protein [Clostridiales Family XIII bacterium]